MKKTIVLLCILQQIGVVGCYAGGRASKTNTEAEHLLSADSSKTHLPIKWLKNTDPLDDNTDSTKPPSYENYNKTFQDLLDGASGKISYGPILQIFQQDEDLLDLINQFEGVNTVPVLDQMIDFIDKREVLSLETGCGATARHLQDRGINVFATNSYVKMYKKEEEYHKDKKIEEMTRYIDVIQQNPEEALQEHGNRGVLLLVKTPLTAASDISGFRGDRLICIDNQGNKIGFTPDPDIWEEESHDKPVLQSFVDIEPYCAIHPLPIRLHLYRRKGSEQSALALPPETDLSNKLNTLDEEGFQW